MPIWLLGPPCCPSPVNPQLELSCPSQAAEVGVPFTLTLVAVGGTTSLNAYSFNASGLPSGLMITASTGVISGAFTTSTGSPFTLTVSVSDDLNSVSTPCYVTGECSKPSVSLILRSCFRLALTSCTNCPISCLLPDSLPSADRHLRQHHDRPGRGHLVRLLRHNDRRPEPLRVQRQRPPLVGFS